MNLSELKLLTEMPKIPNQKGTGQACKALTFSLNAFLWTIFFFFKTASNQFQNFSDVNEQIGELKGETGHMEPLASSGWQRQSFNRF